MNTFDWTTCGVEEMSVQEIYEVQGGGVVEHCVYLNVALAKTAVDLAKGVADGFFQK